VILRNKKQLNEAYDAIGYDLVKQYLSETFIIAISRGDVGFIKLYVVALKKILK
jgi:hypothetical protein